VSLVVDASVAVQWVLPEEGSARAISLRADNNLIAPSLIGAEIGSAIWKAVRRDGLSRQDAIEALDAALLPFDTLVGIEELQQQALEIAIHLNHSIYDCFYLALAERERCASITADAKLLAAAKKMKAKARLL
jgi:predicted nucleic acid-binding protein